MYEMPYYSDDEMEEKDSNMSKEDKKMYGDYKTQMMAEHDVKILVKAGEIRKDTERKKRAVHCAKMQKQNLDSVV